MSGSSGAAPCATDDTFDLFWQRYLRHEAKKDARKAWGQLKPDAAQVELLMQALEVQNRVKFKGKDKKFIPLAASWIRGERWNDEIADAPTVSKGTDAARDWMRKKLEAKA